MISLRRDRSKPFTRAELEALELDAQSDGNELVEQMAGVLLDTESALEKQYDREKELLDQASAFLRIAEIYLPKDGETIGGRISKTIKEGFAAFVKGLKTGKLKPEMVKIHWEHGTPFEVAWRTNWAMMVVAGSIAKMLKKDDGTYWNNITCRMNYLSQQFDVVVQRRDGKSVKDQLNDAEARVRELEAEIAKLRAA